MWPFSKKQHPLPELAPPPQKEFSTSSSVMVKLGTKEITFNENSVFIWSENPWEFSHITFDLNEIDELFKYLATAHEESASLIKARKAAKIAYYGEG